MTIKFEPDYAKNCHGEYLNIISTQYDEITITRNEAEQLFKDMAKELNYALVKLNKDGSWESVADIPKPSSSLHDKTITNLTASVNFTDDFKEEIEKRLDKLDELTTNVHDKLDYKISKLQDRIKILEDNAFENNDALDKLQNDLLEIHVRQEVKSPVLYYKLDERLEKLEKLMEQFEASLTSMNNTMGGLTDRIIKLEERFNEYYDEY